MEQDLRNNRELLRSESKNCSVIEEKAGERSEREMEMESISYLERREKEKSVAAEASATKPHRSIGREREEMVLVVFYYVSSLFSGNQ